LIAIACVIVALEATSILIGIDIIEVNPVVRTAIVIKGILVSTIVIITVLISYGVLDWERPKVVRNEYCKGR
jgi:hypothetical protein